ncbi:MAG: hypothetical protein ACYC2U_07060 [Candidatus Amoebophilus sp.]
MRNPILEKLLPSLDMLIGCMLIMYTSGCRDGLPNPTQNTNLVGQSITTGLSSTTDSQTTTDNQLTLASASVIAGQKDNKRKEPEETATLVSENGSPLPSKRLVPTGELLRLEKEKASEGKEETSTKKLTKRLKVASSKLPSILQKTNREESIQQHTPEDMDSGYIMMEAEKLAELAANNDIKAQEEIVDRCLKGSMTPLLANLINPFNWDRIQEKAIEDARYAYLLLH